MAQAKAADYLPMLVQMLASQLNVKVKFSSSESTAKTNGEELILPTALGGVVTETSPVLINGLICHEAVGHIRHTDFDALNLWAMKLPADKKSISLKLQNIIEDIRIELASIRKYPVARRYLHELIDLIQKVKPSFFNHVGKEPVNAQGAIFGFLLNKLRSEKLGQNTSFEFFDQKCDELFEKDLKNKIYNIAEKGALSSSTLSVIESVDAIVALIEEESKEDQDDEDEKSESGDESSGQGDSESDNQSRSDSDESENDDQNPKGQEEQDDSKSESDKPSNKSQSEKSESDSSSGSKKSCQEALNDDYQGDLGKDLGDALGEMVRKEVSSSVGGSGVSPYSFDGLSKLKGKDSNPPSKVGISGEVYRVSAALEDLLQARVDENPSLTRSGTLNSSMLVKTRLNDINVFERNGEEAVGLNTAIKFMVDGSGSMQDNSRDIMASSAIAISGEALSKFDVPFSVSYFNDSCVMFKDFNETWQQIRGRFKSRVATGSTPISSAITQAHSELLGCEQDRRIAIIVTDGTFSVDLVKLRDTAKKARVEIRFVMVGVDKSFQSCIDYIKACKIPVAIAMNSREIPVAIINSLKEVF